MTAPDSPGARFDLLLALLDADADRAADAYADLRRRLVKFFEWRGCWDAEACADDTLERVARRLAAGVTMTSTVHAFVLGVAANVAREQSRAERHVEVNESIASPFHGDPLVRREEQQRKDRRLSCLGRCVGQLAKEQRRALLRYHQGEARARIVARQQMATTLGIPLQALRLRMFRIRETLERCIRNCVAVVDAE